MAKAKPQAVQAAQEKPVPAPKAKGKKEAREIVYPNAEEREQGIKYKVDMCYGDAAITVDQSKYLLGWTEVESKEGSLLTDRYGKYVVCTKNTSNREINWGKVEELAQTHLRRRKDNDPAWQFNGESIIISPYETVLNGQKSMISHILAEQDRSIDVGSKGKGPHAGRLAKLFPDPITMEKMVVFGISEDDDVVNTLDTAQPRSLVDVMYRSEYFKKMGTAQRSQASRIAGYCIRTIWSRTGAGDLAFIPYQTHDASLDFLERHPGILKAIKWMAEENHDKVEVTIGVDDEGKPKVMKKGPVEMVIEPSRAAALLYLMGMSATDPEVYRHAMPPTEKKTDDANWDAAEEFWTALIGGSPDFAQVRVALALLHNADTGHKPSADEKITVLWKAWTLFLGKKKLVQALMLPKYRIFKDEETGLETDRELIKEWDFGGIDLLMTLDAEKEVERKKKEKEREDKVATRTAEKGEADDDEDDEEEDEEDEEGEEVTDPTPAEIKAQKQRIRKGEDDESPAAEKVRREKLLKEAATRAEARKAGKPKTPPKPKKASSDVTANGEVAPEGITAEEPVEA